MTCIAFTDIIIDNWYEDQQGDRCKVIDKVDTGSYYAVYLVYENGGSMMMEYDPTWLTPC